MHNLKNRQVVGNLPADHHIYVMIDGTFEFEDEHGILSNNRYSSYVDVKNAFVKYANDLFGVSETTS